MFDQPVAEQIWRSKYQYKAGKLELDRSVSDTWRRVADGLALNEAAAEQGRVASEFYRAMEDFKLLPAGRILAGAGTNRHVTLFNTFVMRTIHDSVEGIMDTVKEAAMTMQMGGGIGFDFSTLPPKGAEIADRDTAPAGPLAAMDICDAVCRMLVSGVGRGAMMATMRCDHPDIAEFVQAKSDPNRLRNFNISVMVTDAFMAAVQSGADWDLVWDGMVYRRVNARELWHMIMRQNYDAAEPGVLFIDRINAANPLRYVEEISATNSCAEQPLPPNGACPLASVNLAKLVTAPFSAEARLDLDELCRLVGVAVRMLDNAIDTSLFAVEAQRQEARNKRRIGVGVTGVADALIMLGIRYGSDEAVALLESWMRTVQNAAYRASATLAAARGPFPAFDAEQHLAQPGIGKLDDDVRRAIAEHGLRNGVLTTIAPTGTTSMYGGNVSSGIEPIFASSYRRKFLKPDGTRSEQIIKDYAVWLYGCMFGEDAPLTPAFVTVAHLQPEDHVRMQAAAQPWVDSGISKTVNCPERIPFAAFESVYLRAFESGCKGCTTYRPNSITGSVLSAVA